DNVWSADTAILYGLYDVNGDNPLVLADFERYWEALGSRSARAYDLLNTKFLIARKNAPVDRDKFVLVFEDAAFNVYENTRALPRAFVVTDVRIAPNHAAALEMVRAADFDPAQSVILETDDRRPMTDASSVVGRPSSVSIVGYGPNEIWLNVDAPRAGVLVLSEVFYPGWRAWVNDRDVEVMRANYLFRAVAVPAGTSRVRLLYEPLAFQVGVGVFAVTVVVLCGWLVTRMQWR
ncbi:MAG: YfhO family protein, partial [Anaerolineae bacterium]|nr:YfhO family protein [Anaerolineae bacterium]